MLLLIPPTTLLLSFLFTLTHHALADTVVKDPMQASANSFGWLAIRNFTYCLSDHPDPPDKPRGIQPKTNTFASLSDTDTQKKRLTGMGDSVVVLYHPEQINKAIAWCNTLVAMQSGKNVKCHVALPTCQRCDAVRSSSSSLSSSPSNSGIEADPKAGSKAPSGRLGKKTLSNGGLITLEKRASKTDPNDPSISPPPSGMAARPFGKDEDYSYDPELEPAIAEFQDYCENKLTLAVRADCPFHLVKGWSDEPPFDLHRFCMSLKGSDGHTLHTEGRAEDGGVGGKVKGGQGGAARGGGGAGSMDPNDPIVPFPDDQPQPQPQQQN